MHIFYSGFPTLPGSRRKRWSLTRPFYNSNLKCYRHRRINEERGEIGISWDVQSATIQTKETKKWISKDISRSKNQKESNWKFFSWKYFFENKQRRRRFWNIIKIFIVFHNEDVSNLSQHFQVVARNKFFRKKHIFQYLEYLQTRGFFAYVLKRCRRQNFLLPLYIYSMVVTDTVVGHVSYFIILHRGLSIFLNFFYLFVSYIFHTISTI